VTTNTINGAGVTLTAQDGVSLDALADLNATDKPIVIAANQDGVGTQGFTQAAGNKIETTSNDTTVPSAAVQITVGGSGSALIAEISTGPTGRVKITAAGGSILDNDDPPGEHPLLTPELTDAGA